ncbi:histidine kinase-like ATPase [Syncephalis plumigaleata]|nr:histidine kinase-like ATPase [Syncephalis plumigaleata]
MQTVLEVNATGSGQESKAEMARTSNIIEARAQLRVILAASEKITRMIDDLIDLIFWSTTGVPTVSVLEIRTISVKEMVEMAFSRVEESLNLGGFLAQDSIETEYNLASMTSEQKAKEPALENACPAMRLEIDDQLPEWIQVDRNKIMRVLKHLIRNACQAVGPKGEVVVRVFMEDNDDRPESNERNDTQGSLSSKSIIFSISDNGSGITNDACEQLFILNSDNGDPNHEGAGMGLVVCKGLVQSMSGDLWLEQTMPGKGSEFRVRIPLCLATRDHSTRVTSATDDCRANTQFVEDNFVVRKLIVRMLGRLGMVNVVECENGLVAVQQCRKEHYDLVLMDCGMPVMDGFEASRQILPRDSDSKEAHTEGSSSCQICKESQVRVTKLTTSTTNRIDYCILKPVRFDDLHEVVRQLAVERDFIFKHTI